MKIIIIGCGRVGAALAYQMYLKKNQVTVIDQKEAAFEKLPHDFQGRVVEGDALIRETLHRAGIAEADALAAVTSSDSTNIVIGHLAKAEYRLPKVVVRNYDPAWQPALEAFGLEIVGSASLEVQRMDDLLSASSSQ